MRNPTRQIGFAIFSTVSKETTYWFRSSKNEIYATSKPNLAVGDPNQITKRTQLVLCLQQKLETKANFHLPGGSNILKAVGVNLA